jgi:hypothetical protein
MIKVVQWALLLEWQKTLIFIIFCHYEQQSLPKWLFLQDARLVGYAINIIVEALI